MSAANTTQPTIEVIAAKITPDTPAKEIVRIGRENNITVYRGVVEDVKDAYMRCMNAWLRSDWSAESKAHLKPDFITMLVMAHNEASQKHTS